MMSMRTLHQRFRTWGSSMMIFVLLFTIVGGDISLLLTPRTAGAAYTGKHLRTVEYLLGGTSEHVTRGDNILSYAGSTWDANKGTAGVKGIVLEGSGIVVKNAYIDVGFMISANVNIDDIAVFFDVEGSSSQGSDVPMGVESSLSPWNGSGLSGYFRSVHNVTGFFDRQTDADWNAGIDVVAGLQVNFSGVANRVLSTAKLVITYEQDYSSSAHTEMKTVRFPLDSTTAGDTGSRQTNCAANATCGFTYHAYIPDATADGDILDVRFDMQATISTAASSSLRLQISGGTSNASSSWAEAVTDETTVNVSFRPSVGGANFNRNATQTLNVINGTVPLHLLGGELVVTYRYDTSASLQTETVRYYLNQQTRTPGTARNEISTTTLQISNTGRQARNIWMKMHTAPFAAVTMTAYGKVGGGGTERSQAYVFNAANPRSGDTPTIIFDLSQDAGTFSGATTSIAGANQFSALNGTAVATEVYVTFTWDGSSTAEQTKTVSYSGGQQGVNPTASRWNNWPATIVLPETVTKTYRSAYIETTHTHSETTSTVMGTTTIGVNANTIDVPEAGDTEAYVWTSFYPIATTTFSSASGDISWAHRTIEINQTKTTADEWNFANVIFVTYDADFGENGTTPPAKSQRTVEYMLGGGSDNNTRASATLYYAGTSWNTVKATAGTKNIVLEGSNIRVKNAYLDIGFIVSNSANITNVGVTIDVEGSSSAGTDTRVGGELSVGAYNTSGLSGYFRSTHDVTALFDRQTDSQWASGLSVVVGHLIVGPSKRLTTTKLVVTYEVDETTTAHYEVKTVRFPLDSTAAGDTGSRQTNCAAATTCSFTYFADMPETVTNNDIMDVFFEFGGEVDSGVASTMRPQITGGTAGTVFNWTENFANSTYVSIAWTPTIGGANFNRSTAQTFNILTGTVPVSVMGGEVVVTYRFPIDAVRQTETLRYHIGQHVANPGVVRADYATSTIALANSGMLMKNIWMRVHTAHTAGVTLNVYGKVGTSTERTQGYVIPGTNPRSADTPHIVFDLTQDIGNFFATTTAVESAVQFSAAGGAPVAAELFVTFTWSGKERGPQTRTVQYHASHQGVSAGANYWANVMLPLYLPESVPKTYRSAYLESIVTHSEVTALELGTTTIGAQGSTTVITEANDGTNEAYTATYLHPIASTTLATSSDLLWKTRGLLVGGRLNVADEAYFAGVVVLTYDADHPYLQPRYTQYYYRLYTNHTAITPYDPWPMGSTTNLVENAEITASNTPPIGDEVVRLRMTLTIASTTVASSSQAFKLQYSATTSSCGAVATSSWNDVGGIGSGSAWRGTTTSMMDGTPLSTNPPSGGGVVVSVADRAGTFEEENPSTLNPWPYIEGDDVEYDWAIASNPGVVATSTRYCFRMVKSDGTPLNVYTQYPAIYTAGFVASQKNWQWYDDENNETPSTPLASENIAPVDVAYDNTIKLRLSLREVNNVSGTNQKFKIQFSTSSDFMLGIVDVVSTSSCVFGSGWCYGNGIDLDGDLISTRILTDSTHNGTHNEAPTTTSTLDPGALQNTEYEFTLRNFGADQNTVYFFRAYDVTNARPVLIDAGESYPSLSTEGATLNVVVAGIDNGSTTEGVVTTGTSTATTIPFGKLVIGATSTLAQRITVSTNAPRGYTTYVREMDALLNEFNDAIPGVVATNSQPVAWNSTCLPSAKGCFGYHAGDDSLENSTRFLPDDTWAQLATTSREIMYNSGPVEGDTNDIIYRLFIRQTQQSGNYSTAVIYTVIPTF